MSANSENADDELDLFQVDHPAPTKWTGEIGKLIVNFGGLEFLVAGWIVALSHKNEIVLDLASELTLSRRIRLILDLLPTSGLDSDSMNAADSLWKEVQRLSELRNKVAHNPIVFGWHGKEQTGEPDFIGIPNLKKRTLDPLVDIKELKEAVNASTRIAQQLQRYLTGIMKAQEESS